MQTDHNANGGRGASYCRRTFIKFAAGAAATLPASGMAAGGDQPLPPPSADLHLMIFEFTAISERRAEIGYAIMKIEALGMPPVPLVRFEEFANRAGDYHPRLRQAMIESEKDLAKVREIVEGWAPTEPRECEEWRARIEADTDHAGQLLTLRERVFRDWRDSSGLGALEREDDILFERRWSLEIEICRYPCKSIADLRAKIEFMRNWLDDGDDDYGQQHGHLLRSMVGLLTEGGSA